MNKLLVFPLAMMFLLTMFAFSYIGGTYGIGNSENYSSSTGINTTEGSGTVDIPRAGTQTFTIWSSAAAMVILIAAIAVGIIAGIKVLGSGLNDTSQKMIFNSVLFLGLWACLSAVSSNFLFGLTIITFLWVGLTIMYVIGVGVQISNSSG